MQTKEIRIYKHYQALRHSGKNDHGQNFGHQSDDNDLIMHLVKHWKMPCAEIKKIVRANQAKNKSMNKVKDIEND